MTLARLPELKQPVPKQRVTTDSEIAMNQPSTNPAKLTAQSEPGERRCGLNVQPLTSRRTLGLALLASLFLLSGACNDIPATPVGTVLLRHSAEASIPAAVREQVQKSAATPHQHALPLGGGDAEVGISWSSAKDPAGSAEYIKDVAVTVTKNSGYQISASVQPTPTNRGTEQQPIMSLKVGINFFKKKLGSSSGGTRVVELLADGKADAGAP